MISERELPSITPLGLEQLEAAIAWGYGGMKHPRSWLLGVKRRD